MATTPTKQQKQDRIDAIRWAKSIIEKPFIVVDFETTAADPNEAAIVQVSIVDHKGTPLVNALLNPEMEIPKGASRIHGITNNMVVSKPTFGDIQDKFLNFLVGQPVIAYNAEYERKVSAACFLRENGETSALFDDVEWHCAMLQYADFRGEWNDYFGNNKWHKLTAAIRHEQLGDAKGAHNAQFDTLMTLKLVERMALG